MVVEIRKHCLQNKSKLVRKSSKLMMVEMVEIRKQLFRTSLKTGRGNILRSVVAGNKEELVKNGSILAMGK